MGATKNNLGPLTSFPVFLIHKVHLEGSVTGYREYVPCCLVWHFTKHNGLRVSATGPESDATARHILGAKFCLLHFGCRFFSLQKSIGSKHPNKSHLVHIQPSDFTQIIKNMLEVGSIQQHHFSCSHSHHKSPWKNQATLCFWTKAACTASVQIVTWSETRHESYTEPSGND